MSDLTRRRFLQTTLVTASAAVLTGFGRDRPRSEPEPGEEFFPQSVASGDPKPSSVMLWTRVVDPHRPNAPAPVRLQLAVDPGFARLVVETVLSARPEHDHCLRVKVKGLHPDRHYYYRFIYAPAGDTGFASRRGRTRTAPSPHSGRPVRYAVANCQDYIGRFYHSYLPLLEPRYDNLDFVVHVGDFIYETTGAFFQSPPQADRLIQFPPGSGAIDLGGGNFAAASLDNYRQLHRTYRSDPVLQQVLERFPLVAIWDDHEFANDSWQDHGTYLDGRASEQDPIRKRNAEQAWFEFMPIDSGADELPRRGGWWSRTETQEPVQADLFPNTRIYRDLRFGRNLHLFLSDYRSFRPDHLIPEDAFPGSIPVVMEDVPDLLKGGPLAALLAPYRELVAGGEREAWQQVLTGLYLAEGQSPGDAAARAAAAVAGPVDVSYLALVWGQLAAAGQLPLGLPNPGLGAEALPLGISYARLGKTGLFSAVGARNVVQQELFDALTQVASGVPQEDVYGAAQEEALRQALVTSEARWKVVASSVSFTSMVLDLRQDPAALESVSPVLAAALRGLREAAASNPLLAFFINRLLLTTDQWDGLPNKRKQVLDFLRRHVPGAVCISGDIHGTFVTDHGNDEGALVEFTGPAVSSKTFRGETGSVVDGLPIPDAVRPGVEVLIQGLDQLIDREIRPTPLNDRVDQRIAYVNTGDNGIYVMEAGPARLRVRYHLLDPEVVPQPYALDPAATLALFREKEFVVTRGGELRERDAGGTGQD